MHPRAVVVHVATVLMAAVKVARAAATAAPVAEKRVLVVARMAQDGPKARAAKAQRLAPIAPSDRGADPPRGAPRPLKANGRHADLDPIARRAGLVPHAPSVPPVRRNRP